MGAIILGIILLAIFGVILLAIFGGK